VIRTAIVGLGRWGRSLVEASAAHPRLKIVRAVEPDLAGATALCAHHGLALTERLDAVLADPAIDAVLLATPHSLHPAQVIASSAARKQVFCEKPLALCRADAARMFDACRDAGVVLAVGHNRRFWPSMAALRDITAQGELGALLHIEGHNSNENSQNVTSGWRLSPEESPGGGLTGAGLHVLDAFVSLLGPVRQVYARLHSTAVGPPPLDSAMLALDFADGATGTLATVRATPLYWRVHVFGTKGSAEVLDEGTMVVRHHDGGAAERRKAEDDDLSTGRRAARRIGRLCRCGRQQARLPGAGSRCPGDTCSLRGCATLDAVRNSRTGGLSQPVQRSERIGVAVRIGLRGFALALLLLRFLAEPAVADDLGNRFLGFPDRLVGGTLQRAHVGVSPFNPEHSTAAPRAWFPGMRPGMPHDTSRHRACKSSSLISSICSEKRLRYIVISAS
jgi:predicted dehydrogenase